MKVCHSDDHNLVGAYRVYDAVRESSQPEPSETRPQRMPSVGRLLYQADTGLELIEEARSQANPR